MCNAVVKDGRVPEDWSRSWMVNVYKGESDLVVPRFRLQKFGHRVFAVSGPQIWNSLPLGIRQSRYNLLLFKQKLKAHLFQQF